MKKLILLWAGPLLLILFGLSQQTQAQCVASDNCFDFKFNGIQRLPNTNVRLSFTIKTNCDRDLSHVAFELPKDAKAHNPMAFNYKYKLENTTNNPFYSVKFDGLDIDGYKNGEEDTFTYELTFAQYASIKRMKVEAKAARTVGTFELDLTNCSSASCPAISAFVLSAPNTICNLNEEVPYRIEVVNKQEGVTYEFALPEGFIVIDEGEGFVEAVAVFEEDQLGQPQQISVIARNDCDEKTATATVVVTECSDGDPSGEPNSPLPVTMAKFDGKSRNGAVELAWTTATEKDNDRFEVERSYDSKSFAKIGEVKGNGNSNVKQDYTFTDTWANKGTVYFRLRQVDFDGTSEYSKVIAVNHSGRLSGRDVSLSVYPNPVEDGKVTLRLAGDPLAQGQLTLRLADLTSRILHTGTIGAGAPETLLDLRSLGLGQGIYFISVTDGVNTSTQRLVVR